MILKCGVILLIFYTLLPRIHGDDNVPWGVEDFVEFNALSYEDACKDVAQAQWNFISDPTNNDLLLAWEQAQINYSSFKKNEVDNIRNQTNKHSDDESINHQIGVAEKPGDALLNSTEWQQLVSFSAKAAILRTGANHTDGVPNHSRRETELFLSGNAKLGDKRSTWSKWHQRLSPLVETFSSTLGLVPEAAKANDAESVEEYWELLSGFTSGYDRIKDMWREITELHKKVVGYVRHRLNKKYQITLNNDAIPAYLLGSLEGSDWTSIAADILPYGNVTYSLMKNLWDKNLRGITLYKSASKMGKSILKEDSSTPDANFWKQSKFNQTCSTQLVNFCIDGATRVLTCHQASLNNFLTSHKVVAKVAMTQMIRDRFPIFNTANRYSGLSEAVSELFSILSVSPGELIALNLIDNSTDSEHSKISSLMITALDVLPRLAYYISADLWRIDVIKNGSFTHDQLLQSWWQYRKEYQGVIDDSFDTPTFLDDEFIPGNKPYLSKFVGTVLAFQLYEYLTESTEVRYDTPNQYQVKHPLISMLQEGGADDWTKVLYHHLEIDEHEIAATALTNFFAPLEDFFEKNQEDVHPLTTSQQAELTHLDELFRLSDVTTTPSPTVTYLPTLMPQKKTPQKSDPSVPITPPVSPTKKPSSEDKTSPTKKQDISLEGTEAPVEDESSYTDKISTSNAVWVVAIALVVTITICIIAIFGKRRCKKTQTPKNRRYV